MNGLEQIKQTILDDAKAEAARRMETAKARADEIIGNARAAAQVELARREAETVRRAAAIAAAAESGAQGLRRRDALAARRTAVERVLERVHRQLCALPDVAYFEALEALIVRNAEPRPGLLIVSGADRKRLPAEFLTALNPKLPGELSLAAETRDLQGGCVLKYGDIEVNLAFVAILEAEREQIEDLICRELFGA